MAAPSNPPPAAWKRAPFLRLLPPLTGGILAYSCFDIPVITAWSVITTAFGGLAAFSFAPLAFRYSHAWIAGVLVNLLLAAGGALLARQADPFRTASAIKDPSSARLWVVSLQEPLSEKAATFKAKAEIEYFIDSSSNITRTRAGLLVYLRKESLPPGFTYGSRIAFTRPPRPIENMPAMGDFDYQRYCALNNIHFQVFLGKGDYTELGGSKARLMQQWLFGIRAWVVETIRKYIPGKKEYGLAEALLIGYRDDLDRTLLQYYNTTGVVHVIAISGLHLGVIYVLLKYLCLPLAAAGAGRWLSPVILLGGLWLFCLLAGATPSVVRSAVMFSAIVAGENSGRKTSLLNNLAASAFFLLCYNPYWLWDIGFQLSYTALLGITLFVKPIYAWINPSNALLDRIWQLNAVTLAAQVLTLPLCIFHFHQFPLLFLLANLVTVPLSSLILIGEIFLCAVSPVTPVAHTLGHLLSAGIRLMNFSVERLGRLPFSSWEGLYLHSAEVALLYAFIAFAAAWLLQRRKSFLFAALATLALLAATGRFLELR